MTAPTEAEILDLLEDRAGRYPSDDWRDKVKEGIEAAFDVVGYVELDERGQRDFAAKALSEVWSDLRPSEVERLHAIIQEAQTRITAATMAAIEREVVAAGLRFAAEYPDAPRAERELVSAG